VRDAQLMRAQQRRVRDLRPWRSRSGCRGARMPRRRQAYRRRAMPSCQEQTA
jgi:hypothetical protein